LLLLLFWDLARLLARSSLMLDSSSSFLAVRHAAAFSSKTLR
jgi:hypothetical protein